MERNELIKLSCDSIEKNSPKDAVHIYDGMAIDVLRLKNLGTS